MLMMLYEHPAHAKIELLIGVFCFVDGITGGSKRQNLQAKVTGDVR